MNNKEISVTYNGKSVLIESGEDKIKISKKLAFELKNTLSEFDNMFNFSGRDLTDKEIAFLNMFGDEQEFLTKQENGLIVIIKTPF